MRHRDSMILPDLDHPRGSSPVQIPGNAMRQVYQGMVPLSACIRDSQPRLINIKRVWISSVLHR